MKEQRELQYIELSPRPNKVVRRINEAPAKAEKKNQIWTYVGWGCLAALIVSAFYIFSVALFTYGATF